jgi:hypothetical protein
MPPKKSVRARGGDASPSPPPARRTRGAEQRAPFVVFNEVIDSINIDQDKKKEMKLRLVEKDFTDAFLPHLTKSMLMKRMNIDSDVAMRFQDQIVSFKQAGKIAKKVADPTSEDYDAVKAAIQAAGSSYGSRQKAIDDHCRVTGVMCHSGTVTKKLAVVVVANKPRGKLSQESLDTVTNLMFIATCDTNCKTMVTLRHFLRACALLEQFYSSQEEYLNRMRQPEAKMERSRIPTIGLGLDGPKIYDSSSSIAAERYQPTHFNSPCTTVTAPFSPPLLRSQSYVALSPLTASDDSFPVVPKTPEMSAAASSRTSEAQCQTDGDDHVHVAAGEDPSDSGRSSDTDSDDPASSSDSDGEGEDADDNYVYDSVPPPEGRDITNFNFAWSGPLPGNSQSKLSLRWPRKSQLYFMMKENGWKEMKAQWVDKHRRSGADPAMLRMYFVEKRAFIIRNGITSPEQELNGDECLFRGEITELMRSMALIYCRGLSAMRQDQHAYSTKGADADSFALVIFPVICRKKCIFLQIILKGNPKAVPNSTTGKKQAQLAQDVISVLPAELASVTYCNFTKTGYQTAESFKDASRALLVSLHLQENPLLFMSWSTPMASISPLRRRYMFKVDGSRTHCLKDHSFLMEITSRNLIMFPYTPNATAFIQELDQLCLLLFKRRARSIVKLEIAAMGERPNFSNRFVSLVWAENVAQAYNLDDVFADESRDNFAVSDADNPAGHTGLTTYEICSEVRDIMWQIAARVDQPWGPVRLASMLGHALGAALLNPTVLAASFDAVCEDRVFRRPLVVREIQFEHHSRALQTQKTEALAELASSMGGNLLAARVPADAALPPGMPVAAIPDEKWELFLTSVLKTEAEQPHADIRGLCTLYSSFSDMYDEAHKKESRISAFQDILAGAGNAARHADALLQEQQAVRDAALEKFCSWIASRCEKMVSIAADCTNGSVVLQSYADAISAVSAAIPQPDCSSKILSSFVASLKSVDRARAKVKACVDSCRADVASLQHKIIEKKSQAFPDAVHPAPAQATEAFDNAAQSALDAARSLSSDFQVQILREDVFRDIRDRLSSLPAAGGRGARGGRGRDSAVGDRAGEEAPVVDGLVRRGGGRGGAGRGRGGRGGATIAAAAPAAVSPEASAPASASDPPEAASDAALLAFHNQRVAQTKARREEESRVRVAAMLQQIDDEAIAALQDAEGAEVDA